MSRNILNISDSSCREIELKLKITSKEGFNELLKKLDDYSVRRNLSGFTTYSELKAIKDTLLAFDVVTFDDDLMTSMNIQNWETLREKSKLELSGKDFKRWVLHDMARYISEVIDEDFNYGEENPFFINLHHFLSMIIIKEA